MKENKTIEKPQELIEKAVGGFLDAIICDASTNALVVCTERQDKVYGYRVGTAFFEEVIKRSGRARLVMQKPRSWEFPRDDSITDFLAQDFNLLIIPDMDTLGYDGVGRNTPYFLDGRTYNDIIYFRKAKKVTRAFWFMVNDLDKFLQSVDIDYLALGKISEAFVQEFKKVSKIRFFSGQGAKLEITTKADNLPIADYNFQQHLLGAGGNIPAGEVLITPDNQETNGSIVIDGSFYTDETITVKEPVTLFFENGRVIKIEGGEEAELLEGYLTREEERTREAMAVNKDITIDYLDNIRRISEFAPGLNPKAVFCNDVLIDEKVEGSGHIAIGRSYHGDPAFSHVDLIVRKPRINFVYKDGSEKTIVENGLVLL